MIRKKLASFYNINPEHIEIWLPQTNSYSTKFDYGSNGRGSWNKRIKDLVESRPEWRELCPMEFEVQTYNVKDFDQMTEYDDVQIQRNRYQYSRINSSSSSPRKTFPQRVTQLAMFNFMFGAPNQGGPGSSLMEMTITHCKNWIAKDVINHILKEIIENPIFGYAFFGDIIRYINKYEMDQDNNNVIDLSVLKTLGPERFLIFDEKDKIPPSDTYHMDDEYEMPSSFSQIKYTDFRIQLLAKNDPLVVKYHKKCHQIKTKTKTKKKSKQEWNAN